jgi:DMSO/TMAO reductase YedYZ molybdopterin-dependent catalytic subunit
MKRYLKGLSGLVLVVVVVLLIVQPGVWFSEPPNDSSSGEFPDFITSNEDYFTTRISTVPVIDRDTYRLEITGLIDNPASFSLVDLRALNLTDLTLTTECIGNPTDGKLISTAVWRGFNVYDLLESLGLSENATGVKYVAADGYYVSHTLDQLRTNGILGALYMNNEELPAVQGFPLRILSPGYYGAKQPAWVISMEVIDTSLEDYWDDRGWDTSPPMDVDSMIFFPSGGSTEINTTETLLVGGAAFGGTRVAFVEYTLDGGQTWSNASIVQQIDADHVWVFWESHLSFPDQGEYVLRIRATDINGNRQQAFDSDWRDGTTVWPRLTIYVD